MSEFDAFNSAPSEEADPAADFLAREQSELAGLEDDTFGQQSVGNNQGLCSIFFKSDLRAGLGYRLHLTFVGLDLLLKIRGHAHKTS